MVIMTVETGLTKTRVLCYLEAVMLGNSDAVMANAYQIVGGVILKEIVLTVATSSTVNQTLCEIVLMMSSRVLIDDAF